MLVLGFASDFSVAERLCRWHTYRRCFVRIIIPCAWFHYFDSTNCSHDICCKDNNNVFSAVLYLVQDIIILSRHKLNAWHLLYEQQQCIFRIIISGAWYHYILCMISLFWIRQKSQPWHLLYVQQQCIFLSIIPCAWYHYFVSTQIEGMAFAVWTTTMYFPQYYTLCMISLLSYGISCMNNNNVFSVSLYLVHDIIILDSTQFAAMAFAVCTTTMLFRIIISCA